MSHLSNNWLNVLHVFYPCIWLQNCWPRGRTQLVLSRGATGLGCWRIHNIRAVWAAFAVIRPPKYLPVGGPKPRAGFPKIQCHLLRECPDYSVFWSTPGIVPVGFHILIIIQCCYQVEIFNIEAHIFFAFHAEHAVPQQFRCREIGCTCGVLPLYVIWGCRQLQFWFD